LTAPRLTRAAGYGRAAPPVRLLHLGLGNFFRAHQAWYTDRAPESQEWGYAAFSGRSTSDLVERLRQQQGLYTLVTRAEDGDEHDVVSSLSQPHHGGDHASWLAQFASRDLAVLTLTVTEAGYCRGPDGGLDRDHPQVRADVEALRRDPAAAVLTSPARLVAGFAARRAVDAGPIAVVPCDNEPGNGVVAARVVHDFASLLDSDLAAYVAMNMSVVSTMVDRITPRIAAADVAACRATTGVDDRCPVVTEPFHEWVLSGSFPAGRPGWEDAGAVFTDDVTPYERRKLWLLNGAHSLLAYTGVLRGHDTVAAAVADDSCAGWLHEWWTEASAELDQPADTLEAYRHALVDRFSNSRIQHRLDQIGTDGSQKLPIRILPVLRAQRAAGRSPHAATRVLAAWICRLRGMGGSISDVRLDELQSLAAGALPEAARRILDLLDPAVGADADVLATVVEQCRELCAVTSIRKGGGVR
jgi:fructuronate reductase